jgi:hypothetical protein
MQNKNEDPNKLYVYEPHDSSELLDSEKSTTDKSDEELYVRPY